MTSLVAACSLVSLSLFKKAWAEDDPRIVQTSLPLIPSHSPKMTPASDMPAPEEPLERSHMPGYLIAVIILSIFLGVVVLYKLYTNCIKDFKTPCYRRSRPSVMRNNSAKKGLISSVCSKGSGSIYKKGQRSSPEHV